MISALAANGADLFRINFSHGTHERQELVVRLIRKVEEELDRPIGIIGDLQGPKLRVGELPEAGVPLVEGKPFALTLGGGTNDETECELPHPEMFEVAEPGTDLLLDDGNIRLTITKVSGDRIETEVRQGGLLKPRKGLNYPDRVIPISALSEKDVGDIEFALEAGIDWIAMSFVQRAEDLRRGKEIIGDRARLIAKIEKPEAVRNFDGILEECDAVMVARGDLGVEISQEKVPALQKRMIKKCRAASRPVIVATQMLESMTHSPTPTRAEASDIATALYDGTDAVMLSAESASGRYPAEAVEFMRRIITSTEEDPEYRAAIERESLELEMASSAALVAAACKVAEVVQASAIVSFSKTGNTTMRASRQRPVCPLLGLTPLESTARMATLFWGVRSIKTPDLTSNDDMVNKASNLASKYGFVKDGDRMIVTAGLPLGKPGRTNVLRLAVVGED